MQFASYITLSRAVSGARLEVIVDGRSYEISDGSVSPASALGFIRDARILRVGYEKLLAQRAPIIALPGVDIEKYEESIQSLREASVALADVQDDRKEARAISAALYPIEFLQTMADAEGARRKFIDTGDKRDLERYRAARRATSYAYLRDIALFETAYKRYVPMSNEKRAVAGWLMTEKDTRSALSTMRVRSAQLRRDALVLELCIHGISALCRPEQASHPIPKERPFDQELAFSARNLLSDIFRDPSIAVQPVYVLAESACVEGERSAPAFLAYSENAAQDSVHATRITPISDIRFIRTDRLAQAPYYRQLSEKGIGYVLASPLLHYSCAYLGSDAAKVFALRQIRALSSQLKIIGTQDEYASALRELSARLAQDVVHESDGLQYLSLAQKAADAGLVSPTDRERISELNLATQSRTLGLEDMIALIAKTEYLDAKAHMRGVAADLSAQNLFSSRSGLQVTFLTHVPSISREGVFTLQRSLVASSRSPYVFLSQMELTATSRADLVDGAHRQLESLGFTRP